MNKINVFFLIIIFILPFFLFTNCTEIYTKDQFMKLGDKSKNSSNKEENKNIKVNVEELTDAKYLDYGIYSIYQNNICKSDGTTFKLDTDYSINAQINFYDGKDSGAFTSGKYIRVVCNGQNVKGLGLTNQTAEDLSSVAVAFPKSSGIYIDPKIGKFVLPRPIYWSRCESIDNIKNPDIKEGNYSITTTPSSYTEYFISSTDSKWGKSLLNFSTTDDSQSIFLAKLLGDSTMMDKGTISFWFKNVRHTTDGGEAVYIGFSTNTYIYLGSSTSINIDGKNVVPNVGALSQGVWHYAYILWDKNKSLDGGKKTIRVFIDGTETMYTDKTWISGVFTFNNYTAAFTAEASYYSYFDNIKIWKEVVSEQDPSWEYNSGKEDALHVIYGAANGYKPNNVKVGYYWY